MQACLASLSGLAMAAKKLSQGSGIISGKKYDSLPERWLESCLKLQVKNLISVRFTCGW